MRLFTNTELDELGEGLICQYLGATAMNALCVNIEGFVTDYLKLPLLYCSFAEQDTDKIGFISDGVTPLRVMENAVPAEQVYPKGTIVIERYLRNTHERGRRRFTISHESAHYIMDRTIPRASFHRDFDCERRYSRNELKKLLSFQEAQVDRMGAALLMPRFMVRNVADLHNCIEPIPVYGDSVLRAADKLRIKKMADTMGVSFSAFLIRLRELGYLQYRPISEYITLELGFGGEAG